MKNDGSNKDDYDKAIKGFIDGVELSMAIGFMVLCIKYAFEILK